MKSIKAIDQEWVVGEHSAQLCARYSANACREPLGLGSLTHLVTSAINWDRSRMKSMGILINGLIY
jgi:hypothetical protein